MRSLFLTSILLYILAGCSKKSDLEEQNRANNSSLALSVPIFNADSAYYFVEKQVELGPRIPNTLAHNKAASYFIERFERYGAKTQVQQFTAKVFSGQTVSLQNIFASFNPERKKRVLLAAHWDTRPFADRDLNNTDAAFDGANDGASGVAVLLEIARVIHESPPEIGVDIILFDGEDWGEKANSEHISPPADLDSWYCLGSQYWAKNKFPSGYSAFYGILLDMVGAKGAKFYREGYSQTYAPKVVQKVWNTAEALGYSHIFIKQNQGPIIDDHKYVNELSKIPMIDIVNYDPATQWFGSFHHTQADNINIIEKKTLKAVGETLLHVIYTEKEIKGN